MDTPLVKPLLAFWGAVERGEIIVEDRESGTVGPLIPNLTQRRMFRKMLRQAKAGRPVRIIKPKARKLGVSTLVQALFVFLCKALPRRRAMTYAQTDEDTKVIFRIARRIYLAGGEQETPSMSITVPDTESLYEARTFGGRGVSRGDTIHYMHISELAACQTLSGMDAKGITAAMNAVPDEPHTIIVIESTGDGPTGEFYNMCCKARDGLNSYILDFSPWYHDAGYCRDTPPGFALSESEAGLMRRHGLTERQIAWMRFKRGDHPNEQSFKREFPTTFDDCFAAATGRVYPGFSSAPIKEGGHVGKRQIQPSWEKYRFLDWGAGGEHPFVCLWVAHDPDKDPGLVVHPDCKDMITEFLAYSWNEKTKKPIKRLDHAMDALRIGVATFGLTGFVYVYRCYYDKAPPSLDRIAATIHELSGWELPGDAAPKDISLYRPGPKGEQYEDSCADRSQPKTIEMFVNWGIDPLQAHRRPIEGQQARGEVEDGIALVETLISGKTRFESRIIDEKNPIVTKIVTAPRRPIALSRSERKILRDEREELMSELTTREFADDDEPMGSL